ncbi:uncharacterized protein LOC110851514 [Folsomia candida]|uniref:Uncharacterized protein n=1 Tax=Folsomia candida TaxID=158441 RepID=A0A226E5S5_FOLCA|nr:uncharacterized protein LOC110851514 [Folsomia candida]OXA53012.1 hypothetical protein Fcan01_12537 [Folsomia candida]
MTDRGLLLSLVSTRSSGYSLAVRSSSGYSGSTRTAVRSSSYSAPTAVRSSSSSSSSSFDSSKEKNRPISDDKLSEESLDSESEDKKSMESESLRCLSRGSLSCLSQRSLPSSSQDSLDGPMSPTVSKTMIRAAIDKVAARRLTEKGVPRACYTPKWISNKKDYNTQDKKGHMALWGSPCKPKTKDRMEFQREEYLREQTKYEKSEDFPYGSII